MSLQPDSMAGANSLRQRLLPALLGAAFLVFAAWQITEYRAWREERLQSLTQRTDDIMNAVAGVVNQQGYRRLYIPRDYLENSLNTLVQADDSLRGIALLNEHGAVLAAVHSGAPWDPVRAPDEHILVEAVAYPQVVPEAGEELDPITILPREVIDTIMIRMRDSDWRQGRPVEAPPGTTPGATGAGNGTPGSESEAGERREGRRSRWSPELMRERLLATVASDPDLQNTVNLSHPQRIELRLDAGPIHAENLRDLVVRILGIAMAGLALLATWRAMNNLRRSAQLSVELVQEREKNRYLQDLQMAAAGLAHETRNPLNVVRGIAQSMPRYSDDPARLKSQTETIVDEVDRINSRLSQFIAYSKPRQPQLATVAIAEIGQEIATVMADELDDKRLEFRVLANEVAILADREMLRQIIFNLVLNAIHATPDGGAITLHATTTRDGRRAVISLRDTGPGVPAEVREDIFKPYFSLDPTGTGLGLAIVQQIANAHGWRLFYEEGNPGAVFVLDHIDTAS